MNGADFRERARALLAGQAARVDSFPWAHREAYAAWLAQTYYYVSHSTRLLALAASRYTVADDAFHLRCLEHLREEKSHEKLATADLKALGKTAREYPEFP